MARPSPVPGSQSSRGHGQFWPAGRLQLSPDRSNGIRGGVGKYFAEITGQPAFWLLRYTHQIHPEVLNDGRPDFAANPFNGPPPTYEQARATTCAVTPGPNCVLQAIPSQLAANDLQIAHSWQTSIGMQRQIGSQMTLDFTGTSSRKGSAFTAVNEFDGRIDPSHSEGWREGETSAAVQLSLAGAANSPRDGLYLL